MSQNPSDSKSSVEFLDLNWSLPTGLHLVITTRRGGVSEAPYENLNLAAHVGDRSSSVRSNREMLISALELPREPVWLNQVHGSEIHLVDGEDTLTNVVDADASYTTREGVALAILVADCLPIFLSDTRGEEIAAIHAGWRGLSNGIIAKTIAKFRSDKLLAWLGPAIGPCHYEVDRLVRDRFESKSSFQAAADEDHWLFDMQMEASSQLRKLGVENIQVADICTHCNRDLYSYRRDGVTGRFSGLIWR